MAELVPFYGLLPEVIINFADGQERRDLETFLTQTLKVQETLPEPTSAQWIEWLKKLPEAASLNKKDIVRTTRELYRRVFSFNESHLS